MQGQWPLNAIIYHVYVRSFQDSNNDGIGDLGGILYRLDYLARLGINTLWLSPIYPSPQVDFGYDVSDYKNIDPLYGTRGDFTKLMRELKKRNIRLLMDFVPNHTSDQHSWFKESLTSRNNPKRDWYIWKDPKPDGSPPNNWISVFGGSAWQFEPKTKQYYLHTFDIHQPDLNWANPDVVAEMLETFDFWIKKGVDGFRVDAPYWLFKDETFPDEPSNPEYDPMRQDPYEKLIHTYTFAQTKTLDMLRTFADTIKKHGQMLMVTEVYADLPELIRMYATVDWRFYMPFNFSLITLPWEASPHKGFIDAYEEQISSLSIPNYVLGNHDKPRVVYRVGQKQARIAAMLLLTLRGIPFIYYGDEIGMDNAEIPAPMIKDPFAKNFPDLPFVGRDPQRTPMQWNNEKNAGFSQTEPWLPVNSNVQKINVALQENDATSMLTLYKQLIELRKTFPVLLEGSYSPLPSPAKNVLAFLRQKDNERILVLLNFDSKPKKISLPLQKAKLLLSASLTIKEGTQIDLTKYPLDPDEGIIAKVYS